MSKRGTGVAFCFIAAFLFSMKYISAAIFGSNISSWNSDLFASMLEYVGNGLNAASVISLLIGIIYLVSAELGEKIQEWWKKLGPQQEH